MDGRAFRVKGRPHHVGEFIGDAEEAKRSESGTGCVVHLSPRAPRDHYSPTEKNELFGICERVVNISVVNLD